MENKLQELTQKLYTVGVEKAKNEAEIIIADAQKKADQVIKNAKTEAEIIIDNAKKESAELKKKTESELKLSSKQVIATVKSQITNLVVQDLLSKDLDKNLADNDFMKTIIELIVKKWQPDEANSTDLQIILPQEKKDNFNKYIREKINHLLAKGLTVNFEDNFKSGFKIAPKDNSYIINFAQEDFDNFFKTYLRAQTANLLYGEE
ncbi:MAG: V-type ATP synthase subunit E [Draconibacterium sp.]|nr:V-type ATP synthase subunit E [Draconibacterium sp.]